MPDTPADPLLSALAAIVGDAHVLVRDEDVARHVADWRGNFPGAARAVVRPADTAQVSRVMAACAAYGAAVVAQGGNTGLVGGSRPTRRAARWCSACCGWTPCAASTRSTTA